MLRSERKRENVMAWVMVAGVAMLIWFGTQAAVKSWDKEIAAEETLVIPRPLTGNWERWRCSFYSAPEHGRPTASGEIFDSTKLTCASIENIPFETKLLFVNPDNGRQVECRVTDRMPQCYREANPLRKYDLSKAAAESLGMVDDGVKELLISK